MREGEQPKPLLPSEHRARHRRAKRIARRLGFVGRVEYRHVYSRSGGAQYGIGPAPADDLLVVYAEAFERDADPADFTLEAIIAHECGHQRLIRNANLRAILAKLSGEYFEEVLASLVGSLIVADAPSAKALYWKATAELSELGIEPDSTVRLIERLHRLLRRFL